MLRRVGNSYVHAADTKQGQESRTRPRRQDRPRVHLDQGLPVRPPSQYPLPLKRITQSGARDADTIATESLSTTAQSTPWRTTSTSRLLRRTRRSGRKESVLCNECDGGVAAAEGSNILQLDRFRRLLLLGLSSPTA